MERSSNRIEIPRRSPNVQMDIGGRTLNLCWYNSLIRIYHKPYGHFNHLSVNAPDQDTKGLFFDSDLQSRILLTHSWPVLYSPEPDDHVLGIINARIDDMIDGGLDRLLGGEGIA